ncbi:MAG: serine protease [Christensenellaceae bacterium]|jgi:hypothetical protein|nr:serine protease [Christensenellaceae bacterium]
MNPFSLSSFYTEAYYNDIRLGPATSFAYAFEGKKFLITNLHVVSGKNTNTGKCLDKTASIPNKLIIHYYNQKGDKKNYIINYNELNLSDEWLFTDKIDIAIKEMPADFDAVAINTLEFELEENETLQLDIKDTLIVLGYPNGLPNNFLPIFKTASIASEPVVFGKKLDTFYIDAATRKGMSGSPVLYSSNILKTNKNNAFLPCVVNSLVGIYSGRDGLWENEADAQLGIVWSTDLVIKLLKENITR